MSKSETRDPVFAGLLAEHEKLLSKVAKWRAETVMYRWMNIILFMSSKFIVPIGALVVAMNMIGMALNTQFLSSGLSALIAIVVTLFASLEAMLNPSAKKRLAFTLHNELDSLENKLNMARISNDTVELKAALIEADNEIKRLLNHYADNGY